MYYVSNVVNELGLYVVLVVLMPSVVEKFVHLESLRPVLICLLVIAHVPEGKAHARQNELVEDALIVLQRHRRH